MAMKGSCQLAPSGIIFQPASQATVQTDYPHTVLLGPDVTLHPSQFRRHLMRSSIDLTRFHRRELMNLMIQCFESPFEPPRKPRVPHTAVRVELSSVHESVTGRLRQLISQSS